jgi:hypothetical protein
VPWEERPAIWGETGVGLRVQGTSTRRKRTRRKSRSGKCSRHSIRRPDQSSIRRPDRSRVGTFFGGEATRHSSTELQSEPSSEKLYRTLAQRSGGTPKNSVIIDFDANRLSSLSYISGVDSGSPPFFCFGRQIDCVEGPKLPSSQTKKR